MDQYDPLVAPDPQEWLDIDESERIALVEEYHRRARVQLPNAQIHATVHTVIENQAALGDETPVRRALDRLMFEGLDRHDAIHAIGLVFTEHVNEAMKDAERASPTDVNREYFAAVERVTAASWLASTEDQAEDSMGVSEMLEAFAERDTHELEDELEDVFDDDLENEIIDWQPSRPASNAFKGIGRNDPCPCGSGKKFKKCCLNKAAT
jgi:preprotein translocase subunit SecA